MRTLLAIREMSQKPSFGEVVDSFVLLAYAILAACRTNLQWLIACVKISYISAKVKIISMSYGSCTSSWKPLKMSWAWPAIPTSTNSTNSQNSLAETEVPSGISQSKISNDYKNHPNQHKNSHDVCDEIGPPLLSLTESQWKLRK